MTYLNPVVIDTPTADLLSKFMGPHVHVARYVDIYESDNETLWRGQVPVTEGQVSVDMTRAERRNMQFTFYDGDGELGYGPTDGLWYDKVIKPYRGIVVQEDNFITGGNIQFPNVDQNTVSTPNVAGLRKTGDLTIMMGLASQDYSQTNQTIFAFSWTPGIFLYLNTSGAQNALAFYWYDTTTGLQRNLATAPFDRPANGEEIWLSLGFDIDNGAGGSSLHLYKASSAFGPWEFIGETNNGAVPTTALSYGTTAPLVLGRHTTGVYGATLAFNGFIRQLQLRDGANATFEPDGGTMYFLYHADRDLRDVAEDAASFTTYWSGHVMTVQRTGDKPTRLIPPVWEDEKAYVAPLGEFMIDTIERPHHPALMTVTGRDFAKKLRQAKFTSTTTFVASSLSIEDLIQTIATNGGIEKFKLTPTGKTLTANITFEKDSERWEAINKLAESIAHEVFFDKFGYLVLRPYIDPLTLVPSYDFNTGQPASVVEEDGFVDWPAMTFNYMSIPTNWSGDPSVDYRTELIRPPLPVSGSSQIYTGSSAPLYFYLRASLDSYIIFTTGGALAVSSSYASMVGFPAVGQKVQLRGEWDAVTDTHSMYWRDGALGLDLSDDSGWNLAASTVRAGNSISIAQATWYLGGTVALVSAIGKQFRWLRKVNGITDIDVNGNVDFANLTPATTSFTPSLGGTVTVGRYLGIQHLVCPGTAGAYFTTPDAASLDFVGDTTIAAEIEVSTWTPAAAMAICGKWESTGDLRSYDLRLRADGKLQLQWSTDGTAANSFAPASTVAMSGALRQHVAATIDVNDGAGNRVIRYWTSPDGVNWTILGTAITQAGVTSIFNSTTPFEIAATDGGTNLFTGTIYSLRMIGAIGAAGVPSLAAGFEINNRSTKLNNASTTIVTNAGQTVTILGAATAPVQTYPPVLNFVPPAEIVTESTVGNLVAYNRKTSDNNMFNEVPVRGSGQTNGLVFGRAENNEPLSPTSIANIGRRTMPPIENPIVATNAEAQLIAQKILNVAGLESYDVSIDTLVAPWLESADAVTFIPTEGVVDEPTQFLLTAFTIPFELSPMSCTAKRVFKIPPVPGTLGYGTFGGGTFGAPA